ncbi:MAG TPA: sigma-54 dependent transcriptional regulator [Polyangiales bacterium]|nr:sigma-54 dependent transcriptional regulator [Polyangiales bacterium]
MPASHERSGSKQQEENQLARFGGLVGSSDKMRQLFEMLHRAAHCDATVLIQGETGTGKEVSAHSIHTESRRGDGPFIVVDCGAIPGQLLESELFGYERGAFTGAVTARMGAFEAAHGGTVFLDEIGELGLELQPKILRVLESRKIKRVGSNNYVPVDVRVIAATNRDLRDEVAAKRFRSDLYYRLAVLQIQLPALRDRKGDLTALVAAILKQLNVVDKGVVATLLSSDFIGSLADYRWPGNVRQLRNYVERRVAMGELISPPGADSLSPPGRPDGPLSRRPESLQVPSVASRITPVITGVDEAAGLQLLLEQPLKQARQEWNSLFEQRYLKALLERHGQNVSAAANAAGVNRVHMYRLLWKHGLREEPASQGPEREQPPKL